MMFCIVKFASISCVVASVARMQIGKTLCLNSITFIVRGSINSITPVILFKIECKDMRECLWITPQIIFPILMIAIPPTHTHSQQGIWIIGRNFMKAAIVNTRSAIVSNFAPTLLVQPILRAMAPSIISLTPQSRYRI